MTENEGNECRHVWAFTNKKGEFGVYGLYCSNPECEEQLYEHQAEAMLNEYETLEQTSADLLEALERHTKMFEMVCNKVDFGSAFLDAETIGEWNDASIQATEAIRQAKEEN